jgi:hypothetical protein
MTCGIEGIFEQGGHPPIEERKMCCEGLASLKKVVDSIVGLVKLFLQHHLLSAAIAENVVVWQQEHHHQIFL